MNFGCRTDVFQLPHHRQYLFVMGKHGDTNCQTTYKNMSTHSIEKGQISDPKRNPEVSMKCIGPIIPKFLIQMAQAKNRYVNI